MHSYYTLSDIEAFIFGGKVFTLPENVSNIIKKLENELQVTEIPEPVANIKKVETCICKKIGFSIFQTQ